MNGKPRSVPFSITLLTLMALIVLPLAAALMWLGWRAVDQLEQRSVEQRMRSLDGAVESFLTSGLRLITAVGATLAETPSFAPEAGREADAERFRQLVALLGRHPAVAAVYVGYDDGRFLYAGQSELLSVTQRLEYDAPDGPSILVRRVEGEGAARRDHWWFALPDGSRTSEKSMPLSYDPRTRPWYVKAIRSKSAILTEPYRFAQANVSGVSAGVPLKHGGVIGFDFTLNTLSRLIGDYRITANSIIMIASGAGVVFMESEACKLEESKCLPGEDQVRTAMRMTLAQFADGGQRIERDVMLGGRDYRLLVHKLPPSFGQQYVIAAAVPIAELSADSQALVQRAGLAAVVAVAVASVIAFVAALLLSRSIARIAGKTERIRNLDFSDVTPVNSRISEIVRLSDSIERMRSGLEVFGRYVSKNLVYQIMRSPETAGVGGVRREITVMFTDIEGFSRLSESMEPELLTSRLSRYFDALGGAITANRGMIDKYIGDSIMAFWNAPEPDADHVANACRAALQAVEAGHELSYKWQSRGRPGFRTRVGLHTGPAVVGNVGARDRINYTLVGAVANQASRLEGMNKIYGTEILASGDVAHPTVDRFLWRHIDRVVAAGTTETHDVYEPLGELPSAAQHAEFLDKWKEGRAAYEQGCFKSALSSFEATLALRPDDGPSQVFIERCKAFLRDGPSPGWDGTWRFESK